MTSEKIVEVKKMLGAPVTILLEGKSDGQENMKRDLELFSMAVAQQRLVIRLYGWDTPTVSTGRFDRKDWSFLESAGISFVRRPTAGRAVLHQGDISYSFSLPAQYYPAESSVNSVTAWIHEFFLGSFHKMGVMVAAGSMERRPKGNHCFDSISFHELLLHGKKFLGSAQMRSREGTLQHGSFYVDIDEKTFRTVFGNSLNRDRFITMREAGFRQDTNTVVRQLFDALNEVFEVRYGTE